jgi:hypothetical protein
VVRLGPHAQELISTLNADLWKIFFSGGTLQDQHSFTAIFCRGQHAIIAKAIFASNDGRQQIELAQGFAFSDVGDDQSSYAPPPSYLEVVGKLEEEDPLVWQFGQGDHNRWVIGKGGP